MIILLEDVFKKIVTFLNREKCNYVVIGGIATGVLGEPRLTGDIDIDIALKKKEFADFLDKVKRNGFVVNKSKCIQMAEKRGVFQISYGDYHIDFIIASIGFEEEIFKRKNVAKIYGQKTYLPTPEDLILLKIIPGRPQDFADAEKIAIRYKKKLDVRYLKNWAQRLSDEAQDMRVWKDLERLIG